MGNRLTKGGATYGRDVLNRMTSLSGAVTASYAYRADGMRVSKQTGGVTTLYRHDGQMGVEDVEVPTSGAATVTRYGVGARGVDLIERTDGQGHVVTAFPIYDAHGNNVASLTRNGAGGFSIGDRRTYDAWGVVRAQQSGGDPKLRYCASLGHKADDESGLVYMRARYYEPASGRFVSQDLSQNGRNWFVYCGNDPISQVDRSGCNPTPAQIFWYLLTATGGLTSGAMSCYSMLVGEQVIVYGCAALASMGPAGAQLAATITGGLTESTCTGIGAIAVIAMAAYAAVCGFLALYDDAGGINELFDA